MNKIKHFFLATITWVSIGISISSFAHADCVPPAFKQIAQEYNVPTEIYYAIALQESGRYTQEYGFKVWPWALNINYTTHYPESYEDAVAMIVQTLNNGSEWIAVGMMQVYWKYHKEKFKENPYYALDIGTNLRLGALIFRDALDFHQGDIWKAVGHYYAGEITSQAEQNETDTYIKGVQHKLEKYVTQQCHYEPQLAHQP